MLFKRRSGVVAAGLALFSMFFGAGDLLWPLILGGSSGDKALFALAGLLITGVGLPLLGLLSMMLFQGNYRAFFGQTGKIAGVLLVFVIQAILGPFGSLPRSIPLSYATLSPYLPSSLSLATFSILTALLLFVFTVKRHKLIEIMGLILCPLLLLTLGGILLLGFLHPPLPEAVASAPRLAFFEGLKVGYNTLDLIASFIFAPFVLSYFQTQEDADRTPEGRRAVFVKMVKACSLAGALLTLMFVGLTLVASYYTPVLPPHAPEERLATLAVYLLGSRGALFSCIAVALSCLTTAIPISVISAKYIHSDLMRGKGNFLIAVVISLGISTLIANFGFMGIAAMLTPVLQIICPGLILLCIFNILHKLCEMPTRRTPIYAAFLLSTIGYFVR